MGAGKSAVEYSAEHMQQFKANYDFIRSLRDPRIGEIQVFQNKTYKKFVYGTKRVFSSPKGMEDFIKEILFRSNILVDGLSRILGFQKVISENVCGKSYEITLYGDFYEHDLNAELEKRVPEKDFLSEAEVWYLAERVLSASAALEQRGIYHGDLVPSQIFLSEEGFAKINDHGIVNPYVTGYSKTYNGFQKCYLSPELMDAYSNRKSNPEFSVYKSDIYSFGMTLIYTTTLTNPLTTCYEFSKGVIDHDKVEGLLKQVHARYSPYLTDFIRRMLFVKPEHRMGFVQTYGILQPYRNQIRSMQSFDLGTIPNLSMSTPAISGSNYRVSNQPIPVMGGSNYRVSNQVVNQPIIIKTEVDNQPGVFYQGGNTVVVDGGNTVVEENVEQIIKPEDIVNS